MSNTPWTVEEQETIINVSRSDDVVRIWSNIPAHVRAFSKKPSVTVVRTGNENNQPWGEFTIAKSDYSPAQGVKRAKRVLTDEQRQELADRLAKARAT